LPEQPDADIGYPTVAAALAALKGNPGAKKEIQDGWTVFAEEAVATFWSFPPPGNPAYPAAVRRRLTNRDGSMYLDMTVKCEADKAACDDLVRSFKALNDRMVAELQERR
jgi:hypothetical protein